ncbi:MAG: dihydroorotase family protein [Theionarchaea archaeon]|nr:dihydroorotase family protein [Theionarchaea archaeon]
MLYKNMHVVTSQGIHTLDVRVEEGTITDIHKEIPGSGTDCDGVLVFPSLIDLHVHARDFNQSHKETVRTCSQAALAGGITTIVDMPNTDPPVLTRDIFETRCKLFERDALCDFALHCGVVDTDEASLNEVRKINPYRVKVYLGETTGSLIFHGDPQPLLNLNMPLSLHSDITTTRRWCALRPDMLYICHIASREEIAFLSTQPVLREVTPHHLFLTRAEGPLFQVKPPLGTQDDVHSLWNHLKDIHVIASDHAPHTLEEKQAGAYGISGIETMVPLLLNAVNKRMLSLEDIALRLSENPARLLNERLQYKKGFFVGADADFTFIDLKKSWTIDASTFASRAKHSPFDGWNITGNVVKTIVKGEVLYGAEATPAAR